MYSTDAIATHTRQASVQKNGRYRVSYAYSLAQAVPPIQDETFRGELEPPSSALPADRRRR